MPVRVKEVVLKALDIVQKIAKFDSNHVYAEPLIRDKAVIDGLLHALKAHRGNKVGWIEWVCVTIRSNTNSREWFDWPSVPSSTYPPVGVAASTSLCRPSEREAPSVWTT